VRVTAFNLDAPAAGTVVSATFRVSFQRSRSGERGHATAAVPDPLLNTSSWTVGRACSKRRLALGHPTLCAWRSTAWGQDARRQGPAGAAPPGKTAPAAAKAPAGKGRPERHARRICAPRRSTAAPAPGALPDPGKGVPVDKGRSTDAAPAGGKTPAGPNDPPPPGAKLPADAKPPADAAAPGSQGDAAAACGSHSCEHAIGAAAGASGAGDRPGAIAAGQLPAGDARPDQAPAGAPLALRVVLQRTDTPVQPVLFEQAVIVTPQTTSSTSRRCLRTRASTASRGCGWRSTPTPLSADGNVCCCRTRADLRVQNVPRLENVEKGQPGPLQRLIGSVTIHSAPLCGESNFETWKQRAAACAATSRCRRCWPRCSSPERVGGEAAHHAAAS